MLQVDLIQEFLQKKVISVIGVSRKGNIPANAIFKKFKMAGYETYAVNPNTEEVEGGKCYPNIQSLPHKPEAAMIAVSPDNTEKIVEDCIAAKIPIVWMHRGIGNGSYSEKAAERCRESKIKVITNGCPMMFVGSVDPFHKVFKWIKKF